MKSKQYKTELSKEAFFSKLENYQPFNLANMGIKGKLLGGKGVLECGFRSTKKFTIDFVGEKQVKVSSHIGIVDMIFFCISVLAIIGTIFVFISGEVKEGILCAVGMLMLCCISILVQVLPWKKVEKILKKDFFCVH